MFKEIFSSAENAASHLQSVLPAALVARIDWNSVRTLPTQLLVKDLDTGHSDVLLSAKIDGREALIYVVFEHQSTPDELMAFRMLRYVVGVWTQYLKAHPTAKRLPPVIPCVLYHGAAPWTAPLDCADLIDADDPTRNLLGALLPSMRFMLDDLTAISDAEIERRMASATVRLTLLALRNFATCADPIAEVQNLADLLVQVQATDSDPHALAVILCYLLKVNEPDPEQLQQVLHRTLGPKGQEAFMTAAEKLTKEVAEKSRAEGRAEGRVDGKIDTLLRLLRLKFGSVSAETRQRVESATIEQLDQWTDRVLSAERLEDLFDAE